MAVLNYHYSMKDILNKRFLSGILLSIFILYVISLLVAKPRIANDAAFGFLAMYTWQDGGEWNNVYRLVGNVPVYGFQSWWAPGQYMVPWLFIKAFGLGYGIIMSQVVSVILLFFGYRRLMRSFGVEDIVVYLSLIILLIGRGFNSSVINFSADIYLAVYSVYFLLFYLWARNHRSVVSLVLFLILSLTGLYIKNSFLIVLFCVALYELVSVKKYSVRSMLPAALYTAIPAVIAIGLFYKYYLQRGSGIDKTGGIDVSLNNLLNALLKPLIAVFSAPFSLNSITAKISEVFSVKASKMEDWGSVELIVMAVIVIAGILWLFKPSLQKLKDARNDEYKMMVISFLAGYCIFYFYAILTNKDISTEDRLFLPLSVILIPYLVQRAYKSKTLIVVFCISIVYGIVAYVNDMQRNTGEGRTILANNTTIDGRVTNSLPLAYDANHGFAYIEMPEYCLLLPGKKCVLISPTQVDALLMDKQNTVVYYTAGKVTPRFGE